MDHDTFSEQPSVQAPRDSQDLVSGLRSRIDRLREKALAFYEVHRGIRFGYDYVISARPLG